MYSVLGSLRLTLRLGVFRNAFVDQPVTGPDTVTEQQRILAQVRLLPLFHYNSPLKSLYRNLTDSRFDRRLRGLWSYSGSLLILLSNSLFFSSTAASSLAGYLESVIGL